MKTPYIDNKKFLQELIDYKKESNRCLKEGLPKPRIPNYIGECFMKLANNLAKRPNFCMYCVDDQTEALTQRGWLKYNEINDTDIILSVDPKDLTLKWSLVKSVYRNENYTGKCYKIDGKIDALVTPGHKWLTKRGLVDIDDIISKDHILVNGNSIVNDIKIHDDNFVKLVAWFTTEGCIQKYEKVNGEVSLYTTFVQSKKSKHYNDIILLTEYFEELHIVPHSNDVNYSCSTFAIKGELRENVLSVIDLSEGNKAVKYSFINELTTEQLQILKNGYMNGDGCGKQFTQKCKRNFDSFLYVCALLGERVSFVKNENVVGYGSTKSENWIWVATIQENKNKFCVVEKLNFHGKLKGRGGVKRKNTPNYDYSGIVWCPETEYGTFVARRNGKIYVTGNSYKDEMISDAIENQILYFENFDPEKSENPFGYFTQICWYAFVRRIAKEKKQQYIKYKATESFGILDDEEIQELTEQNAQFQVYDNMYEFISEFEESVEKKRTAVVTKKQGIELFIDEELPNE